MAEAALTVVAPEVEDNSRRLPARPGDCAAAPVRLSGSYIGPMKAVNASESWTMVM